MKYVSIFLYFLINKVMKLILKTNGPKIGY